jgi:hypothetical protein
MKLFTAIYSVLHNKCSRCHQGNVFKHKNPYVLKNMFNMHTACDHCGLVYERETGFFYGAMYASYGLTVGWFLLWYFLDRLFLHLDPWGFFIGIALSIILMSPLTLRWSRLIWLNIFYSYKKDQAKQN